jgi:hypothetical protein
VEVTCPTQFSLLAFKPTASQSPGKIPSGFVPHLPQSLVLLKLLWRSSCCCLFAFHISLSVHTFIPADRIQYQTPDCQTRPRQSGATQA